MIRPAEFTISSRFTPRRVARIAGRNGLGFYLSPTQQAYYGSAPNAGGGVTYSPYNNPLEVPEVSTTDVNGTYVSQPTSPQATQAAAQQFAQALGGQVVVITTPWQNTSPVYGIVINGQTVPATAIADILGNDAMWPSDATKSGEIAKLIGTSYTPGIATALATGQPITTTAAAISSTPPASSSSTPPASSSSSSYRPTVRLENLTSGNPAVIVAGRDHWRISITGARPNAPVSVSARRGVGAPSVSTYGTTDAAGNYSLEGTSSEGDAGTWSQTWTAGSDNAGTLSLQIVTAAAAPSTSTTPAAGSSATSPAAGSGSGSSSQGSATAAGINFPALVAQLPWYAWAGIAGAAWFLGGRH